MDQELKEPSGIEETFKHMIPVEVRMMQDEFKLETNNTLMNVAMDRCGRADQEEANFLQQYNLPQSVHAITAVGALPENVWVKIEDF